MEQLKNIGRQLVNAVTFCIDYLKANPNVVVAFVVGFALGTLHMYFKL